jgi:GAF domain-containing protein
VLCAAALISLAGLFAAQSLFMGMLISGSLSLGLLAALLPPTRLNLPNPTAWLVLVSAGLNVVVGPLFLLVPRALLGKPAQADFQSLPWIMGAIFILSALVYFLGPRTRGFTDAWRGRTLMVPWLIWCGILVFQGAELALIIPPFTLALVLLLADSIPYTDIALTNGDADVPHIYVPTSIALAMVLALLAALMGLPRLGPAVTTWSGIIMLSYSLIYLGGLVLVGMTNLVAGRLATSRRDSKASQAELSQYYQLMWAEAAKDLVQPYQDAAAKLQERLGRQDAELEKATVELASERRRLKQVNLVAEVDQSLEPVLDIPVSAQLTANILQRGFDGVLVTILSFDSARNELVTVAAAGKLTGTVPPRYRQDLQRGMAGRAARLRKTQFAPDTRQDPDHFTLENQNLLCQAAVPILDHGQLKGMIIVDSDQAGAINAKDVQTIEVISERLVAAWQHSSYDARLRELIHAGIVLTGTLETETALREIASTVQRILEARFVFVTLIDASRGFSRTACAGYAPKLLGALSAAEHNTLLEYVLNASQVFRLRDVRTQTEDIDLDAPSLRTLLASPIRLRGTHIGAVLAFGKQGSVAFSEEDESLATLIGNQAAAAIETTWLYQQLRGALSTATLLFELSTNILQAEELTDAAATIAETAYKLGSADAAGIVLYTAHRDVEAQVEIDASGLQPGSRHPLSLIQQTMQSGQPISESLGEKAIVCLPLQTPRRQYGGMWLNIPESFWHKDGYSDNLQTLANQAALALERGILLEETREQREQIKAAFNELETTYDQTLIALTSALDARDHETEGHSVRVSKVTYLLGKRMELSDKQLKLLERGALLHDIGKIGISDTILLKPGPLGDEEWHLMRQHPDIGARIIEGIPFLQEALPVIRYHQERWDGSGYPIGLKATEIPLQARIFAVADVFDALTSHRPYRKRQTAQDALEYLRAQAGVQFDPEVVAALVDLVQEGEFLEHIVQ